MIDGETVTVELTQGNTTHHLNNMIVESGGLAAENGTEILLSGTTLIKDSFFQRMARVAGSGTLMIDDGGSAQIVRGSWSATTVHVAEGGKLEFLSSNGNQFDILASSLINDGEIVVDRPDAIHFKVDRASVGIPTLTNNAAGKYLFSDTSSNWRS